MKSCTCPISVFKTDGFASTFRFVQAKESSETLLCAKDGLDLIIIITRVFKSFHVAKISNNRNNLVDKIKFTAQWQ